VSIESAHYFVPYSNSRTIRYSLQSSQFTQMHGNLENNPNEPGFVRNAKNATSPTPPIKYYCDYFIITERSDKTKYTAT